MLSIKNLCFGYDDNLLFENISIDIKENKIGIIGKNGVGKTTLLNLLGGNLAAKKGIINIEKECYYTMYDFTKYAKFSINDFLKLLEPLESFNTSLINYYINLLDIDEYLDYKLGTLSKGTQKKVSLLITFLSNRKLLLIDEPFESIDEASNKKIVEELKRIDKSYIIVSHDLNYLSSVSEKIYQVKNKGIISYD